LLAAHNVKCEVGGGRRMGGSERERDRERGGGGVLERWWRWRQRWRQRWRWVGCAERGVVGKCPVVS
jgi:hypothetical protein